MEINEQEKRMLTTSTQDVRRLVNEALDRIDDNFFQYDPKLNRLYSFLIDCNFLCNAILHDIEDGVFGSDTQQEATPDIDAIQNKVNPNAVQKTMTKKEVITTLDEVLNNRGKDYGSPRHNHQIAADLFNAYLKRHPNKDNLQPEDTMVLMVLIKIARLVSTPQHVDSLLDIAGYAACAIDAIHDINVKEKYDDFRI